MSNHNVTVRHQLSRVSARISDLRYALSALPEAAIVDEVRIDPRDPDTAITVLAYEGEVEGADDDD